MVPLMVYVAVTGWIEIICSTVFGKKETREILGDVLGPVNVLLKM